MALSKNLISQFVKVTSNNTKQTEDTYLYGTIVEYGGSQYVRLDGSDLLTPYTSTVVVKTGERVRVSVGRHTATVTGNVSSPAARNDDVIDLSERVGNFDILIADKATIKDLEAQKARIDELTADNVTINNQLTANSADIKDLKAGNVTITGRLDTTEANIKNLTADNVTITGRLDANEVDIKTLTAESANIKDLVAGKADIGDLNAATGRIDSLETKQIHTDEIVAKKADIDLANVNNAWIQNGVIKDGSIGSATIHDGAITNVKIADATIEAAKIKSINADTITAGTIKTDRLIITGPDGEDSIVKAINVANGVSEAEVNSQKIQAASIDVVDLSAFKAKIAGFDMSGNAIYSGKESIKDPTSGIYISTTGVGMGDGSLTGKNEAPLQAYADGSFKLVGKNSSFDFNTVTGEMNLEVTNLKISSKVVATKDDVAEVENKVTTLLRIESSKGTAFKNDDTSTVLSVVLYHGNDQITDSSTMKRTFGADAYLQWRSQNTDDNSFTAIQSSDSRLGNDGFTLTPSQEDMSVKVTFKCELVA
jgi:hypothetical protein